MHYLIALGSALLISAQASSASASSSSAPNTSAPTSGASAPGMTTDLSLPADKKSGEGTFYDEWKSELVSCNPMRCPDDGWCAAIPTNLMGDVQKDGKTTKASCGKCIKVVYEKKAVILRVMDTCPGCGTDKIDLSTPAFVALTGDKGKGRVKIEWGFVDCNGGAISSNTSQSASASASGSSSVAGNTASVNTSTCTLTSTTTAAAAQPSTSTATSTIASTSTATVTATEAPQSVSTSSTIVIITAVSTVSATTTTQLAQNPMSNLTINLILPKQL